MEPSFSGLRLGYLEACISSYFWAFWGIWKLLRDINLGFDFPHFFVIKSSQVPDSVSDWEQLAQDRSRAIEIRCQFRYGGRFEIHVKLKLMIRI